MKVSYDTIWATKDVIPKAINEVKGLTLSEKVQYVRVVKSIKEHLTDMQTAINGMINELGTEVPVDPKEPEGRKQKSITNGTDAAVKFNEQLKELSATEVDVPDAPVEIVETDAVDVPLDVLEALMDFLKFKKVKAPSNQKK